MRKPRFTIRGLFALMTIVAIALAVVAHYLRQPPESDVRTSVVVQRNAVGNFDNGSLPGVDVRITLTSSRPFSMRGSWNRILREKARVMSKNTIHSFVMNSVHESDSYSLTLVVSHSKGRLESRVIDAMPHQKSWKHIHRIDLKFPEAARRRAGQLEDTLHNNNLLLRYDQQYDLFYAVIVYYIGESILSEEYVLEISVTP